jgi:hypothetical protein
MTGFPLLRLDRHNVIGFRLRAPDVHVRFAGATWRAPK